ncbi:MAG TPA: D-alanyl-D-alanine carboxypeptidase [Pyrinomonadaceae bacterium]|nr:D-alanyl-D-alanine carboxypeptidase [Pyrinomonadaceae bacterium]
MGGLKTGRLILSLVILLSSLARVSAQVERTNVPPRPPLTAPVTVPTLPPATQTNGSPVVGADDILPQLFETPPVVYRQGVLVEKLDGGTVLAEGAEQGFNPASAVKLATALVALRSFGPKHRFATAVWINGTFDKATGTVTGDLVLSGRDPSFHYEHAVAIARELNQLGIRTVSGDLIVAPRFTMNFNGSALRSGESFYDTLDATRRPAAATRAWYDSRIALGDTKGLQAVPSVAVMGAVYVASVPSNARVISTHYSSPLVDVLKVLLCYSNNFMAERLGDALGGPKSVERFLTSELGIPPGEVRLASASGLGVNRLSPRGMMKVYRALLAELKQNDLKAADILPVAGIDPGTLQRRYADKAGRGSIIGKTGTLGRTDGGASALVGQMRTRSGETLLFVIFNQRGNVARFRQVQDAIVADIQNARGGPMPFTYTPHTLAMRLSNSEFDSTKSASLEEYEPQN